MPQVSMIRNPLASCWAGSLACPQIAQVVFESGTLSDLELVHARGMARENFNKLYHIANRMNEKNITYREAYLELRSEGIV